MRNFLNLAASLLKLRTTKHGLMMFTTMVLFNADITYVFYKNRNVVLENYELKISFNLFDIYILQIIKQHVYKQNC